MPRQPPLKADGREEKAAGAVTALLTHAAASLAITDRAARGVICSQQGKGLLQRPPLSLGEGRWDVSGEELMGQLPLG